MALRDLDGIFRPHRVAVIDACEKRGTTGCTVLHNLITADFQGVIYPVNATREAVQGIPAFPALSALPKVPDLAVVCSPTERVLDALRACGEAGVRGMVIATAGFRETGEAGRAREEALVAERRRFPHLRVVGPNSLGLAVPAIGLNASAAVAAPRDGRLAFLSQSGALSNAVLDWALEQGIGFSCFVSLGNAMDVSYGELIDYLGADAHTRAIILYLQAIERARGFMSAARAFARVKPIVAYKAGRFAESARAAASHTGAMVAEDLVYQAAFERAGVVRVQELDDVFDVAELLASQRLPNGPRLAIITNAGGPGVIAADALIARRGELAELAEDTRVSLEQTLPAAWSRANPVDLLDDAPPERYEAACQELLKDSGVDALLVLLSPQAVSDPLETAQRVATVAERSHKPVLATWMGGARVQEAVRVLNRAGLPTHRTPELAVRAFMHLVSYAQNLKALYETPRNIPVSLPLHRGRLRRHLLPLLQKAPPFLDERLSKALLRAHRIPVACTRPACDPEAAVAAARRLGYPVVVKVLSPDVAHKVEAGGVAINLGSDEAVRSAFRSVVDSVTRRQPQARVDGVTVQPMVTSPHGIELILGAKKDPTFGAVIMVGAGGVAAALMQDRTVGLPPLNERLALRMLESLRAWPLLKGYRGMPAVNLERLLEVLIRFSYLVADYPEVQELDINPLLATPDEVRALDAEVVLDPDCYRREAQPYEHLSIAPYPEDCVRRVRLHDGTPVTLRPIRPEDEPLWHELHAGTSPESLRQRFRSLFKYTTHEMATRYCFIDYAREMTIVAEVADNSRPKLLGVGGFSTDPDREGAEYAVMVADQWQGRGLGGLLLDYSEELARRWGIHRLYAETDWDNLRMQGVFKSRGFDLHREDDVVTVEKAL